jgi:hypothetical protein
VLSLASAPLLYYCPLVPDLAAQRVSDIGVPKADHDRRADDLVRREVGRPEVRVSVVLAEKSTDMADLHR